MILFSILITCLFKIILILKGEILSWSLKRVRGFNTILISNETTASDDMLAHSWTSLLQWVMDSILFIIWLISGSWNWPRIYIFLKQVMEQLISLNFLPWWQGKWRILTVRKKSEKLSECLTKMEMVSLVLLSCDMWWQTWERNLQTRKLMRWSEKQTLMEMGKSIMKVTLTLQSAVVIKRYL